MGASTLFDYLRTIVQLLPYYIPPVVIANLINMIFFFFLLGAVEVIPFLSGLLQRSAKTVIGVKYANSAMNAVINSVSFNVEISLKKILI